MTEKELMKMTKKELIEIIKENEKTIDEMKEKIEKRKGGRPALKISKEEKETIIKLYKQGWGYKRISEKIGISHTKIRQIIMEMIQSKENEEE